MTLTKQAQIILTGFIPFSPMVSRKPVEWQLRQPFWITRFPCRILHGKVHASSNNTTTGTARFWRQEILIGHRLTKELSISMGGENG